MAESPDAFEEFKDNDLGEGYVNAVLSSHFEHHTYSGVLLTYAIFEEFFVLLTGDLRNCLEVTTQPSDLKDRGVRRYKKFIHKVCAVDTDALSIDWSFLVDFAVVRDCIVHANGNKARFGRAKALFK